MDLGDVWARISRRMKEQFEMNRLVEHSAGKGTLQEAIVSEFLRSYLPQRFAVGTGELIDTEQRRSGQQDIVIYDRFNAPRLFPNETYQVFPCETVYAVIEVKSKLTKAKLAECLDNFQKVKALEKLPIQWQRIQDSERPCWWSSSFLRGRAKLPTLCAVFAFDAVKNTRLLLNYLETLRPDKNIVDLICIFERDLITNRYTLHPRVDPTFEAIAWGDDSLLWFFSTILDYLYGYVRIAPTVTSFSVPSYLPSMPVPQ